MSSITSYRIFRSSIGASIILNFQFKYLKLAQYSKAVRWDKCKIINTLTANCEITCSLRSLLGYQVRVISSSFVGNFSPKKTSFLLFDSTYDLEIEFFDNIMRKNQIVTIAQFSENYRRLRSLLRGPTTSYLVLIRR